MVDSDDDYVQEISDDEIEAHQVTRGGGGTRKRTSGQKAQRGRWDLTRTWKNGMEGADGTIDSSIAELLEASKRKRVLKDTTPLQRGIIRHLILVIDLSSAMEEKDLRPSRFGLTLQAAGEFVTEFFEQNPISQLGIIGMRDGIAIRVSDMSGNPSDHRSQLLELYGVEPKGNPSVQNALDMGRAALYHAPAHGTREILIISGSLLSSDPGDIHATISALVAAHITCTVVGLAAQVALFVTLVTRTNPALPPSQSYTVALNEVHFRELLMRATTPPATPASDNDRTKPNSSAIQPSLLMMGFPSRIVDLTPTLCACHSRPTQGGYLCTRCSSKVCSLPATCPVCKLTLVLSTHLARSYHHLFPLQNWTEVSWERAEQSDQRGCFGCQTAFPKKKPFKQPLALSMAEHGYRDHLHFSRLQPVEKPRPRSCMPPDPDPDVRVRGPKHDGVSESGRYECETCNLFFCIDCDVFCHEIVHNCPGCQSREGMLLERQKKEEAEAEAKKLKENENEKGEKEAMNEGSG